MAQTELERLFTEFINLDYSNGNIYKSKRHTIPLLEDKDAEAVIADFFDGRELVYNDIDDNPENEVTREVNGYVFVEWTFGGDFEKAWEFAKGEIL